MTNPALFHAALNGSLAARDRSGALTMTGSGAVRYRAAQGARTNLVKNPRVDSNSNYWGTTGVATMNRIVNDGVTGSTSLEIDTSAALAGLALSAGPGSASIRANVPHVLSFSAKLISGASDWEIVALGGTVTGTSIASTAGSPNFAPTAQWQRFAFLIDTSAIVGTHRIIVRIRKESASASVIRITDFVLEEGSTVSPVPTYFDGTTGAWLDPYTGILGTPHASPSVSQAAAWVEEGTTNLVVNPSAEVDATTGVSGNGATLTRDTTYAYLGAASFKLVTNNAAADEGILINTALGLALTGSARVFAGQARARGVGTVRTRTVVYYTDATSLVGTFANVTLTDTWAQIVAPLVTVDPAKTISQLRFDVLTQTQQAATFYVDAAQLEEKAYATSYCDGSLGTGYTWTSTAHASASTRAATAVKVDETNRVSSIKGAFAAWVYLDANLTVTQVVFMAGEHGVGKDRLDFDFGGALGFRFRNSINAVVTDTIVPGGRPAAGVWRFVYAAWDGTATAVSVDNGAMTTGTRGAPTGVVVSANNMAVGLSNFSSGHINGLTGPVAIYDRPLTNGERSKLFNAGPNWSFAMLESLGQLLRVGRADPVSLLRVGR